MAGSADYDRGVAVIESTGAGDFDPEIVTPDAQYEKLTNMGLKPIDQREWLKSDPPDSLLSNFEPLIFEQYFGENPTELVGFLRAATDGDKITTGKERGTDVTRYRARLSLERALKEVPVSERKWFRHDFNWCWTNYEATGVPLEFALDGEGRLRRVDVTLFCKGARTEWTIELFDYGVEVAAKAPPADEVMTHEELDELWYELTGAPQDHEDEVP